MLVTCTRSYHALRSKFLTLSCSSGVEPKYCWCRLHGRGRKHPRSWRFGLEAHVQRQCVFWKGPGHRGLCSGPRLVADGCGAAYLISKNVTESVSAVSQNWESVPIVKLLLFKCTAHTTNAKRLVSRWEAERSCPSISTHVCRVLDLLPTQLYVPEPQ